MSLDKLPVAIIGAGPIGLAAAAHLVSHNIPFILLEKGDTVGASILQWAHVKMFSSWALNIDITAKALLLKQGWKVPDDEGFPTGKELVEEYLLPLSQLNSIKQHTYLGHQVEHIQRPVKNGNFELTIRLADSSTTIKQATSIIDASGTWDNPNPLVSANNKMINADQPQSFVYGIPDVLGTLKDSYVGKSSIVIGNGYSAINALQDLVKLKNQTQSGSVTWVRRTKPAEQSACRPPSVLPESNVISDNVADLAGAGHIDIVDDFLAQKLQSLPSGKTLLRGTQNGKPSVLSADNIVACTGSLPDLTITQALNLSIDSQHQAPTGVAALINKAQKNGEAIPEPHGIKALSHPEANYFSVGMKSHGTAPNFFLMSGYEQVRSIACFLAGDVESAHKIDFAYPENGACGAACGEGACCAPAGSSVTGSAKSSCCG